MNTDKLREAAVRALAADWEIDEEARIVRRRSNASQSCHSVWAMYCFLKEYWLKGIPFRFPIRGDGLPSIAGSTRRYEWTSESFAIAESDLPYLNGGPLFAPDGSVLVFPNTVYSAPMVREEAVLQISRDWEVLPREIRRKEGASSKTYSTKELYEFVRWRMAQGDLIVFNSPLSRDSQVILGLPRRYYMESDWTIAEQDLRFLNGGPLVYKSTVIVEPDTLHAQRLAVDDVFPLSARVNPAIAAAMLEGGVLPYPEADVKRAFNSIIGEPYEQKDWSGERSDLFTRRMEVSGQRLSAAFLLKGPSVGAKMHMSDLGKRGDQVHRLFGEPAELFVVQFNGAIDSEVDRHVRMCAEAQNRDTLYCIIDGVDTARVLYGYGEVLSQEDDNQR